LVFAVLPPLGSYTYYPFIPFCFMAQIYAHATLVARSQGVESVLYLTTR